VTVAYLITFRTYGSWLHGDDRGSVDRRRFNTPGEPTIPPRVGLVSAERANLRQPPVRLTHHERDVIREAIRTAAHRLSWTLHAINVRTEHVHVVVSSEWRAESLLSTLKAEATRTLRRNGLRPVTERIWSRHGSTKYLWDDNSVAAAVDYVLNRQDIAPS
jgi:REP element-mobilizing transposase RayT